MRNASRKHVVKSQPVVKRATTASATKALAGIYHRHACLTDGCPRTYEDDCHTPAVNGTCRPCRGKLAPVWDEAHDPRPCCAGNTVLVTDAAQIVLYRIAGPGPWFRCKTCVRHHPSPITHTEK